MLLNLLFRKLLFLRKVIFLIVHLNTAAGTCSLLLSCIERMALRTNFYVDIFLSRACYESISAVAGNSCIIIIRMYSVLHLFHLFLISNKLVHIIIMNDFMQVIISQ